MTIDLSQAHWHTSSRSNGGGECVEVADDLPGVVAVRDSKDRSGPVLVLGAHAWTTFVSRVKSNALDR